MADGGLAWADLSRSNAAVTRHGTDRYVVSRLAQDDYIYSCAQVTRARCLQQDSMRRANMWHLEAWIATFVRTPTKTSARRAQASYLGLQTNLVLWHTNGDCQNYGILAGHKGAVLDLHWSRDSRVVFSASADLHLASWDVETGQRIRKHPGHEEVINCMDVSKRGEEILFSASDDGYIGVS